MALNQYLKRKIILLKVIYLSPNSTNKITSRNELSSLIDFSMIIRIFWRKNENFEKVN